MYSQLLKEIIMEMEYNDQMKTDFIHFCSIQFGKDRSALQFIDQFGKEYKPLSAISWYSRESFLYSMLNRALRMQDVPIIF
jgi:hypothetical protein